MMQAQHNDKTKENFKQKEYCSSLVSKNVTIFDRRTSVRLEPEMWKALADISKRENCNIHALCSLISHRKAENSSLTAAIRVFVMLYFRAAATEQGHDKCGHGNFMSMVTRAQLSPDLMAFFTRILKKSKWKTGRGARANN